MSLHALDAPQSSARAGSRRVSTRASSSRGTSSPASSASNATLNAFVTVTAEQALARPRSARMHALRAATAGRSPASRSRTRTSSARAGVKTTLRLAHARQLHRAVRRDGRRAAATPPAWSCSARPTWTSSRWARRTRRASTARCAIRGTRDSCRAARRAAPRPRSPRASRRRDRHRHRRLDPPAGRALRHHRHQADLRPRVALRHDRVRVEPRPGRRAHADRPRMRRSARRDGRLRPARLDRRSTSPCRATRSSRASRGRPSRSACPRASSTTGSTPTTRRCRAALADSRSSARGVVEEHRAAEHPLVGADVLRRRARRSVVESVALRRRALRSPLRERRRRRPDRPSTCATRGEGFGAEVKRRILTGTYVLSAGYFDAYYLQGAEGAQAHQRRLRARVPRRRRASRDRRRRRRHSRSARRPTIRSRCT